MKNVKKTKRAKVSKNTAYLTKRDLVRVASAAVRKASDDSMQIAGYVVKAENGWIVRENSDGSVIQIEKLKDYSKSRKLVLD
ncbi:hypothetical protein [Algoriphagus boritolerans]|uniref:Uncharacterized protein n=1 Tax=Algoriphagus boritolerans DSM 17298 = JCM 18970 TaxID=1120964 RepID=A0A1H5Y311_9BACT|nr:hypothetical protein [Algoriphagus boritolerans]SEG18278.1 hypothetical protein SAMN03080598_02798 [Algoriphagus boritolerans DSM 17298 = JCM 18970]